jgi:hypothetical protein
MINFNPIDPLTIGRKSKYWLLLYSDFQLKLHNLLIKAFIVDFSKNKSYCKRCDYLFTSVNYTNIKRSLIIAVTYTYHIKLF